MNEQLTRAITAARRAENQGSPERAAALIGDAYRIAVTDRVPLSRAGIALLHRALGCVATDEHPLAAL